ncbi:MAG: ArsR family transcriptional regulator, partial [Chloroflexi bacterium]
AAEAILEALASGPLAAGALARATTLSPKALEEALDYLKKRDLVGRDADGRWDLLVPLMRRWLRLRQSQVKGAF